MTQQETGFESRRKVVDGEVIKVMDKYGIPHDASLQQIEPYATTLLTNLPTLLEGAQLVLGRRVDAKELSHDNGEDILPLVASLPTGKERFGALLMQCDIDRRKAEKKA